VHRATTNQCLQQAPWFVSIWLSAVVFRPIPASRTYSEVAPAPEPGPSDRQIAAGVAAGDEWAADALYDRVHPVVDRSLRRILRSTGPDYDDLVQAAFERIIGALSKTKLDGQCDLRAWSAAVATHVALDSLRRKVLERKLFWSEPLASGERPTHAINAESRLEARSEVARLQGILARMNPHAAETLLLHDVLGYELLDVASMMGVSVAAAQSRLVRSRKELLRRTSSRKDTP
jgi:RNA polymerase sigma factor (sigma-70 family)